MRATGFTAFSIDSTELKGRAALKTMSSLKGPVRAFAVGTARNPSKLSPEEAALGHLNNALESKDGAVKKFARPSIETAESAFKSLGAEALPLTGTTAVKFRQTFNKIPVYGSLVTVELGKDNECLGINSSMGTPAGIDHVAKVAPAAALKVAAKASGHRASDLLQTPKLYYYFDQNKRNWYLAYIIENVPQNLKKRAKQGRVDASMKDYVIEAHTGKLLAELPRMATMASVEEEVLDALNQKRKIVVESLSGKKRRLHDSHLNVTTYGFGFKDPTAQGNLLPGSVYLAPPIPWPLEAVGAHANGSAVARFLRETLKRNNIDNKGGEMISTVNCCDRSEDSDVENQWRNAYWNGHQMVYGQIKFPDGSFFSVASMQDVVAHEMFHGVTDQTSRLEYVTESGALNESFSDVFGIIIANFDKPLEKWDWEIGAGFNGPGKPLRSLKSPTRYDQPKHMRDFRTASPPFTDRNDNGWVHDNSGIHNYAAYRVMTSKVENDFVFSASEIAAMFYLALTQYLSRQSQFSDSRRAVLQAARSLFRNEREASLTKRVKAIEAGFSAAGIK